MKTSNLLRGRRIVIDGGQSKRQPWPALKYTSRCTEENQDKTYGIRISNRLPPNYRPRARTCSGINITPQGLLLVAEQVFVQLLFSRVTLMSTTLVRVRIRSRSIMECQYDFLLHSQVSTSTHLESASRRLTHSHLPLRRFRVSLITYHGA